MSGVGRPARADPHRDHQVVLKGGFIQPLRRHALGLTLLETLVAMTILASAIVGMTYALSQGSRAANHGILQERALELATNQLNTAVARGEDSPIDSAGESGRFQWQLAYEEKEHGLVLAIVTINWLEQGRDQSLSLSELYLPRSFMTDGEAP